MREGGDPARNGLLVLVIFAVYGLTLTFGFVWDDIHLFVSNRAVQDFAIGTLWSHGLWHGVDERLVGGVYADVYRPWVLTTFAAAAELPDGLAAPQLHFSNLALHAANTLLFLSLLSVRIPTSTKMQRGFATLVFALHPTRVESVAWISGCMDLWMTFGVLASFALLQRRDRWRYGSVVAFALALFSKETALLMLPLLALEARRGSINRKQCIFNVALLVGVTGLWLALRSYAIQDSGTVLSRIGALEEASLRALRTLLAYVGRVAWPWPTTPFPAPDSDAPLGPYVLEGVGTAVILLVALFVAWLTTKRRVAVRELCTDLCWFILPLLPVLNFVDLDSPTLIADRFLYLPLVGLLLMLVRLRSAATRTAKPRGIVRAAALAPLSLLLVAYAFSSASYARAFETDYHLWRHALASNPADLQARRRLLRESAEHLQIGARLDMTAAGIAQALEVRREDLAVSIALIGIESMQASTADVDQGTLHALLGSLVRFRDEGRFQLRHHGLHFDFRPSARQHMISLAEPELHILMAELGYRTGGYRGADAIVRAVRSKFGEVSRALLLEGRLAAHELDWERFDAVCKRLEALDSPQALTTLRVAQERTRLFRLPDDHPDPSVYAQANAAIALEDHRLARQLLSQVSESTNPPALWFELMFENESRDGLMSRALGIAERAQAASVEPTAKWNQAVQLLSSDTDLPSRVDWSTR